MLKFLGRGSGFSDNHNTAFFMKGSTLVLLDCSIMAFLKLKNGLIDQVGAEDKTSSSSTSCDDIVVLVTHTHSDHVAGIPMLIQYSYFVWKKNVTIIAPCEEVKENLAYCFDNMEGINKDAYEMITADESNLPWLRNTIPTMHVKELEGKCFGYNLEIDGTNVVYTGDTCRIEDFLDYLENGSILYTECSSTDVIVHTPIEKILEYDQLFAEKNIQVYLMHLDDENKIMTKLMVPHKAKYTFAPLYK